MGIGMGREWPRRRANRLRRVESAHQWAFLLVLGMMILLALGGVPLAAADDGITQDEVNAVARRLFCPVCENTPLDVCPTEACQQWREVIRSKLSEGQPEDAILAYFAEMYGDSVLAEPPPSQVAAWLLPVLIVLAALGALGYWLRSWTHSDPVAAKAEPVSASAVDDPYLQRVELELLEWE